MADKQTKLHDGYVGEADFTFVKDATNRGDFQQLVYGLIAQEPDLAIGVSERFAHILTLLDGCSMSVTQRAMVQKQLTLLTWTPLLALALAHRRAWADFLPATDSNDEASTSTETNP